MQSPSAALARQKVGRRRYLVDRRFQLKYTLLMVVVGAAISTLFGVMMYQAHVEATQLMELPDLFRTEVAARDDRMLLIVVAITVVMSSALGLFGILVTHRIAGPIYVFTQYVRVIGQGRFPRLRPLRRGDELKGFYEAFHEAVESMRAREKARGEELKELAKRVEAAANKSPEAAAALKMVSDELGEMGQQMIDASQSQDPATPGQKAEAARAA